MIPLRFEAYARVLSDRLSIRYLVDNRSANTIYLLNREGVQAHPSNCHPSPRGISAGSTLPLSSGAYLVFQGWAAVPRLRSYYAWPPPYATAVGANSQASFVLELATPIRVAYPAGSGSLPSGGPAPPDQRAATRLLRFAVEVVSPRPGTPIGEVDGSSAAAIDPRDGERGYLVLDATLDHPFAFDRDLEFNNTLGDDTNATIASGLILSHVRQGG